MTWLRTILRASPRQTRPRATARPACEPLEDRRLLSAAALVGPRLPPTAPPQPATTGGTASGRGIILGRVLDDMSSLAARFPRHTGPTVLALNFDGDKGACTAFSALGSNRDQDIQDILFETSEVFSPFDVEVVRVFGDGTIDRHSGASTVFIGVTKTGTSYTPATSSDYPGDTKGNDHRPNSDAQDIGFVNPFWSGRSVAAVVGGIAHEAGHTFGLAHVLTDGGSGSADARSMNPGVPDAMSYNKGTPNQYFADQTFDITDLNATTTGNVHDGSVIPKWNKPSDWWGWLGATDDVPLHTQNSFAYLQTVLGARAPDGQAHVADLNALDPRYRHDTAPTIAPGASVNASVARPGDYDVFTLVAPTTQLVTVNVQAAAGSAADPVLLRYSDSGTLQDFAHGGPMQFVAMAGVRYRLVIGAENGASTGGYRLTVLGPETAVPIQSAPVLSLQNLTPAEYYATRDYLDGMGYHLAQVSAHTAGAQVLYAAVWESNGKPHKLAAGTA